MKQPRPLATRLFTLFLTLVLLLAFAPSVLAVDVRAAGGSPEEEITPRIDETEWVFKVENGIGYKRLWSYTQGKWLTDWIEVGYV